MFLCPSSLLDEAVAMALVTTLPCVGITLFRYIKRSIHGSAANTVVGTYIILKEQSKISTCIVCVSLNRTLYSAI